VSAGRILARSAGVPRNQGVRGITGINTLLSAKILKQDGKRGDPGQEGLSLPRETSQNDRVTFSTAHQAIAADRGVFLERTDTHGAFHMIRRWLLIWLPVCCSN
jgi:hypothetical protein